MNWILLMKCDGRSSLHAKDESTDDHSEICDK